MSSDSPSSRSRQRIQRVTAPCPSIRTPPRSHPAPSQPGHAFGRTSPTPGVQARLSLILGSFCRIPYLLSSTEHPAAECYEHPAATLTPSNEGLPPEVGATSTMRSPQKIRSVIGRRCLTLALRGERTPRKPRSPWASTRRHAPTRNPEAPANMALTSGIRHERGSERRAERDVLRVRRHVCVPEAQKASSVSRAPPNNRRIARRQRKHVQEGLHAPVNHISAIGHFRVREGLPDSLLLANSSRRNSAEVK